MAETSSLVAAEGKLLEATGLGIRAEQVALAGDTADRIIDLLERLVAGQADILEAIQSLNE